MEITTIQFLKQILIDSNYGYERDARTSGKIYLQQYNKGFLFLGAYIKPYRTYIGNKTKMKFKALVLEDASYFEKKKVPIATISKFRDSVNSYLGIMKHHKTFNLKLKTLLKKQPNLIYNYGYFTSNLNIYKIKNNEL